MGEGEMTARSEAALSPVETADLRHLDPKTLRFFRHGATLRLTIEEEASFLSVSIFRAFPLSEPHGYYSVRYGSSQEVGVKEAGMIVDPRELDAENRRLVEEDLERRYLVPVIRRVIAVRERFGTVDWEVETERGVCRFTTRNTRENVAQVSPNRYLLTDVDGNRYDVQDLTALDPASQGWLLRHL